MVNRAFTFVNKDNENIEKISIRSAKIEGVLRLSINRLHYVK